MVYRHKTIFMHKNACLYKILKIRRINRQMLEHWVYKRKEIRKIGIWESIVGQLIPVTAENPAVM